MNNPREIRLALFESLVRKELSEVSSSIVTQTAASLPLTVTEVIAAAWKAPKERVSQLSMPVLLCTKEHKGIATYLTLTLVEGKDRLCQENWLPSWEMRTVPLDLHFRESLTNARLSINALEPTNPVWPDDAPWHILWHLDGKYSKLNNGSLGAAFAVAALTLLQRAGKLPASHPYCAADRTLTQPILTSVAIAAEVRADGRLGRVDKEGLDGKQKAAGYLRAVFTAVDTDSAMKPLSPVIVQASDLRSLMEILREMGAGRLAPPRRSRRKLIAATVAAAVIIALGVVAYGVIQYRRAYPDRESLARTFSGFAMVNANERRDDATDEAMPPVLGIDTRIEFSKFSRSDWENVIVPKLKLIHKEYILRITGDDDDSIPAIEKIPPTDWLELTHLNELPGLRGLEIIRAPIRDISSVRFAENLRRLVIVGSPVSDLKWLERNVSLEQICLDSGYVNEMPRTFPQPKLDDLYVHYPPRIESSWSLPDVKVLSSSLRRLWLAGDDLSSIDAMSENLEELTVLAPDFRHDNSKFSPWSRLLKLDLRAEEIETVELENCVSLLRAKIYSPILKKLTVPAGLVTLDVSRTPIASLELSGAQELRHIFLDGTSMPRFPGLTQNHHLNWFSARESKATEMPRLSTGAKTLVRLRKSVALGRFPNLKNEWGFYDRINWTTTPSEGDEKLVSFNGGWFTSFDERKHPVTRNHFDVDLYGGMSEVAFGNPRYFAVHRGIAEADYIGQFDGLSGWTDADFDLYGVFEPDRDAAPPVVRTRRLEKGKGSDGSGHRWLVQNRKMIKRFNGWSGGIVGPQPSGNYWLDDMPERDVKPDVRYRVGW